MIIRIKKLIKHIIERLQFDYKLKQATPILVYQMGKVASSSIYHALKKSYRGHVIHIHQFNEKCWYWEARQMYRYFSKGKQSQFKVITLIREPIGRNVSEFFHRFKMYNNKVDFERHQFSLAEIRQNFLNNLDHDYPLNWFDENLKRHFNIDVYSKPFPDRGFEFYSNGAIEVLLMKFDLPDNLKNQLIADFVGLPAFEQEVRNVGENKSYKDTYLLFKREVKLPDEYLYKMAASRYFRHFYSSEFIEKTIATWKA